MLRKSISGILGCCAMALAMQAAAQAYPACPIRA